MPDLTYKLTVTEKKLAGNDAFIAAAAGDGNNILAQFAGLIPRSHARSIDLLDEVIVEVTFVPQPVVEATAPVPPSEIPTATPRLDAIVEGAVLSETPPAA